MNNICNQSFNIDINRSIITPLIPVTGMFVANPAIAFEILCTASLYDLTIDESISLELHMASKFISDVKVSDVIDSFIGIVTGSGAVRIIRDYVDVISIVLPELKRAVGFNQYSKYHNLDVFEHTLKVLSGIPIGNNNRRDTNLACAALFHDLGKPDVFVLDEAGVGHMKKHQEKSKQIALDFFSKAGFPEDTKDQILKLVLFHDTFPSPEYEIINKYIEANTYEFLEELFILQRADIMAHSKLGQVRINRLNEIMEMADYVMNCED